MAFERFNLFRRYAFLPIFNPLSVLLCLLLNCLIHFFLCIFLLPLFLYLFHFLKIFFISSYNTSPAFIGNFCDVHFPLYIGNYLLKRKIWRCHSELHQENNFVKLYTGNCSFTKKKSSKLSNSLKKLYLLLYHELKTKK